MNQKQIDAARQAMTEWLAHPQELGKAPAKIEYTETFELHDMRYYIFRYKKSMLGKWLLGVCGGYEGDELEHCGHVFSEMEEYDESTAVESAKNMVEMIRSYWMQQAEEAEERKKSAGVFLGFALLSDDSWDKEQLMSDLKEKWDIIAEEGEDKREDSLIFSCGDMLAALSLMPAPIPDGEAETNAENNYMWPEAVKAAREHKAHIMVSVMGNEQSLIEKGKLYVKLLAACCSQKNVSGIYSSGVVFEPRFYEAFADMMKDGRLPVFNWIWFGLYRSEKGVCGYTYGMEAFGKDEMEVLDADDEPSEVRDFLAGIASYVLEYDAEFLDGETVGFSAEDKHSITRSQGSALPGKMTLKISYEGSV